MVSNHVQVDREALSDSLLASLPEDAWQFLRPLLPETVRESSQAVFIPMLKTVSAAIKQETLDMNYPSKQSWANAKARIAQEEMARQRKRSKV